MRQESTRCCIVGGGPAGMMLGYLLARAGIDVLVLEKHRDFLRDFRGDTVHPSTLELMHELGLLDGLLALPHEKAEVLKGQFGDFGTIFADFRHLPTRCRFVAFMPQWDFLNFMAAQAARYPGFRLQTQAEATDLLIENDSVVGVRAATPDGPLEIRAGLVVGCDGRHAMTRAKSGLPLRDLGAPMDVLWFRLSRRPTDPDASAGRFDAGAIFVMINRGDYWQCGYVIAKGSAEALRAEGIAAFRTRIGALLPFAADRPKELADWDAIKLLTVGLDRLERWHRRGLLIIGDAAHTMSPVGGVGINLAIQDAVAAANLLAGPLRAGAVEERHLAEVQRRRELPTRIIQGLQRAIQNRIIRAVLTSRSRPRPPLAFRLLARFPVLARLPARLIGIGVRPEHIRAPEAAARR